MTHPNAEAKLSASKRLLRAAGQAGLEVHTLDNGDKITTPVLDPTAAAKLALILSALEFDNDLKPFGSVLLRKMRVEIPAADTEHEGQIIQAAYQRAAVIAVAVALTERDTDGSMLFRRAREVFNTLYGSPHAIPSTRSTGGYERPRKTAPPVETKLTNEERHAVVFAPNHLFPEKERTALANKIRGLRLTGNAEKLALYRARRRIIHLKESGLMDDVVTLYRKRLEEADSNSQRLDMIEKYLGLDAVKQAEDFLKVHDPADLSESTLHDLIGD
jgi:hypothetical protein